MLTDVSGLPWLRTRNSEMHYRVRNLWKWDSGFMLVFPLIPVC